MADDAIPPAWRSILEPELARPEARRLSGWLAGEEAAGKIIYPTRATRLRALALTPPEAVRVTILGQDPYHGAGQAHGLAFSVPPGVAPPPSLRNIFRELASDCGIAPPDHGNLEAWARQGVLLLNTTLSVEAGRAGSHAGQGWEAITGAVVRAIAQRPEPGVFILWGTHAQDRAREIPELNHAGERARHCVIRSAHPSPLSAYRGFFGSRPFSRANAFLGSSGRGTVDWSLK